MNTALQTAFSAFSTARRVAASTLPLALLGGALLTAGAARAQHIGQGQALNVNANALGGTVAADVSSGVAGPLPGAGGSFAVGPQARAGSLLLVDGPLALDTSLTVTAGVLNASTNGAGLVVNSAASVGNVQNPGTTTNLSLGINPLGLGNVNFLSLVAIQTNTGATVGSRTSTTTIVGLTVTDLLGVPLVLNGTTLLNANLTFADGDPTAGISITGVADILFHEKVNNGDGSRTTNGIRVSLLSGPVLGSVANAGVTIASSTAGVSATAAPEPGAAALILAGLPVAGLVARRRARR